MLITVGVYGSLKRGKYNHARFGLSEYEHVKDTTIRGAMYSLGSYPKLYKQGLVDGTYERDHVLEVYRVPIRVYEMLNSMEIGAGYVESVVNVDGENVIVWLWGGSAPQDPGKNWLESY